MVKNLPASAGDNGFDLWSRKMTHDSEQLSQCATAIEPALENLEAAATEPTCCTCRSLCAWGPCFTIREAIMMRSPRTAAREYPWLVATEEKPTQERRPSRAKNNK